MPDVNIDQFLKNNLPEGVWQAVEQFVHEHKQGLLVGAVLGGKLAQGMLGGLAGYRSVTSEVPGLTPNAQVKPLTAVGHAQPALQQTAQQAPPQQGPSAPINTLPPVSQPRTVQMPFLSSGGSLSLGFAPNLVSENPNMSLYAAVSQLQRTTDILAGNAQALANSRPAIPVGSHQLSWGRD